MHFSIILYKNMVQLETKYQKHVNDLQNSHRISWNSRKKSNTSQCFSGFCISVFCQIIVTPNIHKTARLKIIKIIFYQQPKLPSLITKKKMMKVFLWRPTWAHFRLELLWQFAIGHRIWVETLNYPACKERCPWVH